MRIAIRVIYEMLPSMLWTFARFYDPTKDECLLRRSYKFAEPLK